MAQLTKEQIQAAAKYLHMNEGIRFEEHNILFLADHLQLPWEPITEKEWNDVQGDVSTYRGAANKIILNRNAALLPKPVDERREKIISILKPDAAYQDTLIANSAYRVAVIEGIADRILAALDGKEK